MSVGPTPPSAPLTIQQLALHASGFAGISEHVKQWLTQWPMVVQGAAAYRTHVAEQREFLKWVAAFASAGLFLVLGALRSSPAIVASSTTPLLLAIVAFSTSVLGAGIYWWRVDLTVGRFLEGIQHQVNFEIVQTQELLLTAANLRAAVDANDAARGNAEYLKLKALLDESTRRVERTPSAIPGMDRPAAVLKLVCLGGYAVGVLAIVADQVLRVQWR